MVENFSDVIALWPNTQDLADALGVKADAARKWKARNRIPPEYWSALVAAGVTAGHAEITFEKLARLAAETNGEAAR